MANCIFEGKEIILQCSNWEMNVFHEYLESTIAETHHNYSKNLLEFIERLDQKIYGPGGIYVDVVEYFKDKKSDLIDLIQIVNDSIKEGERKNAYTPNLKQTLIKFRLQLNDYLQKI